MFKRSSLIQTSLSPKQWRESRPGGQPRQLALGLTLVSLTCHVAVFGALRSSDYFPDCCPIAYVEGDLLQDEVPGEGLSHNHFIVK